MNSKMTHVQSSAVHVQIMRGEAQEARKTLLEVQLLLLSTVRNLLAIKELRETEFRIKREGRSKMQEVSRLIKDITSALPLLPAEEEKRGVRGFNLAEIQTKREQPKEELPQKPFKPLKPKIIRKDKKARLNDELEAIKRRLESL